MYQKKIDKLTQECDDVKKELALYTAIQEDYCVAHMPVVGIRTDAVYDMFKQRHPDVEVSQHRFTRLLCDGLGLKSVQGWLDGKRGSFYERGRLAE